MKRTNSFEIVGLILLALIFFFSLLVNRSYAKEVNHALSGNFGLPGIIDVPTARRFPDGEIIFPQQLHRALARSGVSFQALPRIGFSFRYSGHGRGGWEAHGRYNHDRSFDAHLSILDEGTY